MHKSATAIVLATLSSIACAQMTPVGNWNTVDDKTGEVKSIVRITDIGGSLSGVIAKILVKDAKPDAICDKCSDDRKDKPMLGLQIIRGAKKTEGKDVWEGGKVLDPESGTNYTLRLTPIEDGKKLEMRGSFFGIGKTQTWVRVQ